MNLKTLRLASAIVLFATSPMLAQKTKRENKPKSDPQGQTLPSRPRLEIKGDRVGESFAVFKAHYPNAKCKDLSSEMQFCSLKDGVSLAGLTLIGPCDPPTTADLRAACDLQGVVATFERDKLTLLSYTFWVNGAANDSEISTERMCDALARKYGKPDLGDGRKGCAWFVRTEEGEIAQTLLARTNVRSLGERVAVLTEVVLGNGQPSKDI